VHTIVFERRLHSVVGMLSRQWMHTEPVFPIYSKGDRFCQCQGRPGYKNIQKYEMVTAGFEPTPISYVAI
jgi:hypothetical protein